MATLLAWDFDWSLIEENSDTLVIRLLGADDIYNRGREEGMPWTQLMDHTLQAAARQLGSTPADVEAALGAAPLHPALADLLREGAALRTEAGEEEVDVVVLSDANTVYIDSILRRHGLHQLVQEVHTNPAAWDGEGALRVAPHHAQPHGCRHRCPANLCKGKVLLELLQRRAEAGRQYRRVLYVGDGRGDHCPARLLLRGGRADGDPAAAAAPCGAAANRVFARERYPDGAPCALWVMLRDEHGTAGASCAGGGSSRVVPWQEPRQLAALLRRELGLPTGPSNG